MESFIFVLGLIKGEFWHFKVERRVLTSGTVNVFNRVESGRSFGNVLRCDVSKIFQGTFVNGYQRNAHKNLNSFSSHYCRLDPDKQGLF